MQSVKCALCELRTSNDDLAEPFFVGNLRLCFGLVYHSRVSLLRAKLGALVMKDIGVDPRLPWVSQCPDFDAWHDHDECTKLELRMHLVISLDVHAIFVATLFPGTRYVRNP